MSTAIIMFFAACIAGLVESYQPRCKPVKRKPHERIHHAVIVYD